MSVANSIQLPLKGMIRAEYNCVPLLCTLLPKKIYVEDEYIVCVGEAYEESKFIDDVAKVIDHGEFYELVFPFGNASDKFICQKGLLTKGTLEEFEQLFSGKITRK